MKNSHTCPKCGSRDIVRIPDHPSRYASGSNIYTTRYTLLGKVPVIRYVCCGCGYVENWVESPWSCSRSTRPTGLHDSSKAGRGVSAPGLCRNPQKTGWNRPADSAGFAI